MTARQTVVIADAEDMPETAVEVGLYLIPADLQAECDGPNSGGHTMECDHCERIVAQTFRDGIVSDDPFRPFVMGEHTVMCLPCLMTGTASGAYVILNPAYMATDHTVAPTARTVTTYRLTVETVTPENGDAPMRQPSAH